MKKLNLSKAISIFLTSLIVLAFVSYSLCGIVAFCHDCTGETCLICLCISSKKLLEASTVGAVFSSYIFGIILLSAFLLVGESAKKPQKYDLVSLRVKLSN